MKRFLAAFLVAFALASSTSAQVGSGGLTQGAAPYIRSLTWANKPTAGIAGQMFRCSDCGTKGSLLLDDGTRWKPAGGCAVLATLDTASAAANATPAIAFQYLIPAGLVQNKDRLEVRTTLTKNGGTDAGILVVWMGTTGTISGGTPDTTVTNATTMAGATQRAAAALWDYRLESATSIQQLGNSGSTNNSIGYSNASTSAVAAAVTIPSVAANPTYFTISIASAGASNTVVLSDAQLKWCATPN